MVPPDPADTGRAPDASAAPGPIPIVELLDAPNGKFVERAELHEIDDLYQARIRIVRRAAAAAPTDNGPAPVIVLGRWLTVPALRLGFGTADRARLVAAARQRHRARKARLALARAAQEAADAASESGADSA